MTAGAPSLGGLNRLQTAGFRNITSNGVPTFGTAGLPLTTGHYFFVDAVSGNDNNSGSAAAPLATITAAYALTVDGRGDVVVLVSRQTTAAPTQGTFRLSAQLEWANSNTHLVGLTAPAINQRARISTASGATANIANLVAVSGQGCIFSNFSIFQGVGQSSTAEQLWQDAGQRNYYSGVSFLGMGSANGAGQSGSYTLKLYGGSENVFDNCYFGADTTDRSTSNSNILLRKNASNTASTRNIFRDCIFAMRATAGTPTFIDANESGGIDRFALFQRCLFTNFGSSAVAAVVAFHASQGGYVIIDNCTAVACTDWTASDTATVQIAGPVPNGDTSGMAVASDKT